MLDAQPATGGRGAVRYQDPLRLGLLTVVLERAFAKFEGSGFRSGCLGLFGLEGLNRNPSERLPSRTAALIRELPPPLGPLEGTLLGNCLWAPT